MSGGNWMPELVATAGGTSLFRQAGKHSPWLDWDDLRAADPLQVPQRLTPRQCGSSGL